MAKLNKAQASARKALDAAKRLFTGRGGKSADASGESAPAEVSAPAPASAPAEVSAPVTEQAAPAPASAPAAEPVDAPAEDEAASADLSSMTVPALRALARERNLTGYSRMTKAQLVELLSS
ncbi:Rho termination factor N-terminal domain-containing protein [Microbacterium aureliae]